MLPKVLKSLFFKNDPTENLKELKKKYEENGYVILKNFFKMSELESFSKELEQLIKNRAIAGGQVTVDVLEGDLIGKRLRLKDVPDEAFRGAHKVNDLYLESEACRNLNLNQKLLNILEYLLEGEPIIINSLSFRKGSQQPHHFDTYYMPPPTINKMIVSSICLENQTYEVGPLSYYPGSHKIPPFIFSHGKLYAIEDEMLEATKHVESEIEKQGLQREEFIGEAGDVFVWHAQLYHGGAPITNHEKTRKTLVTHYWRNCDIDADSVVRIKKNGGYLKREHQKV